MKRLFFILLICFTGLSLFSQSVTVQKPGQLDKEIKKNSLKESESISINGIINLKDIADLAKYPQLTSLEFKDVSIVPSKKNEIIEKITFPLLPNVVKLYISSEAAAYIDIDLTNLPSLNILSGSETNTYIGISNNHLTDFFRIDNWPSKSFGFGEEVLIDCFHIEKDINGFTYNSLPRATITTYQAGEDGPIILSCYNDKNPDLLFKADGLGKTSLSGYNEESLIVPSNIKLIYDGAFDESKIKKVIFTDNFNPENLTSNYGKVKIPSNITTYIPKGTYNIYKEKIATPIFENGVSHTLVYNAENGLPLQDFIRDYITSINIDTLKIIGKIKSETELEPLNGLKNMRVLDLTECVFDYVPNEIIQNEHNIAKQYLDRIWNKYLLSIKKVNDKYADEMARYLVLGFYSDMADPVFSEQASSGLIQDSLMYLINKFFGDYSKENIQKIIPLSTREKPVIEEFTNTINNISKFYPNIYEMVSELKPRDPEAWEEVNDPVDYIRKLEKQYSKNIINGDPSSDTELAKNLTKIDPIFDYYIKWGNRAGEFFLYKREKLINNFNKIKYSDLTDEFKDEIINTRVNHTYFLRPFNSLPNLNLIITNPQNVRYNESELNFKVI